MAQQMPWAGSESARSRPEVAILSGRRGGLAVPAVAGCGKKRFRGQGSIWWFRTPHGRWLHSLILNLLSPRGEIRERERAAEILFPQPVGQNSTFRIDFIRLSLRTRAKRLSVASLRSRAASSLAPSTE